MITSGGTASEAASGRTYAVELHKIILCVGRVQVTCFALWTSNDRMGKKMRTRETMRVASERKIRKVEDCDPAASSVCLSLLFTRKSSLPQSGGCGGCREVTGWSLEEWLLRPFGRISYLTDEVLREVRLSKLTLAKARRVSNGN